MHLEDPVSGERFEKDDSIVEAVRLLRGSLGDTSFKLVDHWDSDLCAIGISSCIDENVIVYMSTFGKPAGHFFFECESPVEPEKEDAMPCKVKATGDMVNIDDLADIIREHLEL